MAFVVAGLIVVFLLCAVDLVLTVGVIRRLREHTGVLSRFSSRDGAPDTLPVGATVAPFTALTIEGQPVSREMLETPALVGLLSATCESCHAQLPRFLERAAGMPGRDHVLAVVVGAGDDPDGVVPRLSTVARVVMEEPEGRIAAAFGASMFPVAYLIEDEYAVAAAATRLDRLPPVPGAVQETTADR
jgi:hypothetical protein